MVTLLPLVVGIAFGPAVLLAVIRLSLGARAARATWRLALRWAYLGTLLLLSAGLAWWVFVDEALMHEEGPLVTASVALLILLAFSGALAGVVARTRWLRMAPDGTVLR